MGAASYTEAVRNGVRAAGRLQRQIGLRDQLQAAPGAVDVFAIIAALDLPLMVRPLKGLLGAYIDTPSPGILVTTERPLSIQRFTAAHELGHRLMAHRPSLDDEEQILRRGSVETLRQRDRLDNYQEAEADAFAAALMMPKWLIQLHCTRQGWRLHDLNRPHVIYQLSLRLGASYEATARTLERHAMISSDTREALVAVPRKSLKAALLGEFAPKNYKADVWLVTERDQGGRIEGSRNDHLLFALTEKATSGYLWDLSPIKAAGFRTISDDRVAIETDTVGGVCSRRLLAAAAEEALGTLTLDHARPWVPREPLDSLSIRMDFTGPEAKGLSRAERRLRLDAA